MKAKKIRFRQIKKKKILFLFFTFVIFLFLFQFRSKNYEINYEIKDILITEKYSRKEKIYEFQFKYMEKNFYMEIPNSYLYSKKIIQDVEIREKEGTICIIAKSKHLKIYPICLQNNEFISFNLINDEELIPKNAKKVISYEEKTFKKIKYYHLNGKKYFIWNYEGFDILTEKEQKELHLFNEDIYNIPLVKKVGQYLVMADYDNSYVFHKFYVIDSKKNKIKELNLKNEVSFESYFLGNYDNNTYLVDKKNENEFEINPKKMQIQNIVKNNKGRILKDGLWKSVGMNTLTNNNVNFTYKDRITYNLENQTLYRIHNNYKIKISNQAVKEIIEWDPNTVYYLVDEKLYYYNDQDGEVLVLSNFEWNFNFKNMIYIF